MRNAVCLFLKRLPEGVERADAAARVEYLLCRFLAELFSAMWLAQLVSCERERMCVNMVRVFDGNVPMVFVKLELRSRGIFPSLDDYDGASTVLRAWRLKRCVLQKQRVYAVRGFEAQKKLLKNFVFI